MKTGITAAIFLALAFNSNAQTYVGVKAGTMFARMKSGSESYPSRLAIVTGVTFEKRFRKSLLVGADLLYEQRIVNSNVRYTDKLGNLITPADPGSLGYNAISLPVYFGFKSTLKTVFIGLTGGIIPAYMPSPYIKSAKLNDSAIGGGIKTSIDRTYFDLSPMINAWVGLKVKGFEIGLNGRYQYSIIGVDTYNGHLSGISGVLSVMYKL